MNEIEINLISSSSKHVQQNEFFLNQINSFRLIFSKLLDSPPVVYKKIRPVTNTWPTTIVNNQRYNRYADTTSSYSKIARAKRIHSNFSAYQLTCYSDRFFIRSRRVCVFETSTALLSHFSSARKFPSSRASS